MAVLVSTVALGSTLGLSGCVSSDDEPDRTAPVESTVDGVAVKLLDAGTSPTDPLAWFADDGEQKTTYSVSQGLGQHTVGGDAQGTADGELPYSEVTMELPLTATAATDEGDGLAATVTAGTPTGDNDDRNDDIASAEGFRMVQKYSDDGKVSSRSFAAPEGASDSARASVEQGFTLMTDLPLVFPEEAVGEGARWTVTGQVSDSGSGVSMRQTVTYTIASRNGSQVNLDVDIERTPTVKQMAGTDLEVMDSTTESTGSLTLDLRRPLPVSGSVKTTTEITYGQPESPVTVVQESRTTSTWSSDGEQAEN
ncbi:MAG: hypothetical protein ACTIJP_00515 [Corynebacterium variabile]|uniref:Uncharacterized protein n=1 Tax=Corynebacterium variabile TaxID=1727 RepID=A0A0X8XV43_9CORY|nr:hypothetical protein [Corynebacterium variabile]MDN6661614.1 hypothetical protein [Corynebacterium variabile]CUU65296.1 hypothetical protein CVAR292_00614 [Corynebacterium variabile]